MKRNNDLFFFGLTFVSLVQLLSLYSQVFELVGPGGLLPVHTFLEESITRESPVSHLTFFWLGTSDLVFHAHFALAFLALGLSFLKRLRKYAFFSVFLLYFSLNSIGQSFMSKPPDTLLLELLFFSSLFAGAKSKTSQQWYLFALKIILLKVLFFSGLAKVLGDEKWHSLSALHWHLESQPLPLLPSWYLFQMPAFVKKAISLFVLLVELGMAFFIFINFKHLQLLRKWLTWSTLLLMIGLLVFGNYGTLPLQVIILLPLVTQRQYQANDSFFLSRKAVLASALVGVLCFCTGLHGAHQAYITGFLKNKVTGALSKWYQASESISFFRVYNLFAVIALYQRRLVIETGSSDGLNIMWYEKEFGLQRPNLPTSSWLDLPRLRYVLWPIIHERPNVPSSYYQVLCNLVQKARENELDRWFSASILESKRQPLKPGEVLFWHFQYRFTDLEEYAKSGRYMYLIRKKSFRPTCF